MRDFCKSLEAMLVCSLLVLLISGTASGFNVRSFVVNGGVPNCKDLIHLLSCNNCEDDYYRTEDGYCVAQDENHCGPKGLVKCSSTIAHWKNGNCSQDKCHVMECIPGYYPDGEKCQEQTAEKCGNEGTHNCLSQPGVTNAECVAEKCVVTACQNGYFIKNNMCQRSTDSTCLVGDRVINCQQDFKKQGWISGYCQNGGCVTAGCISGYHLYGSQCEPDSAENCHEHGNSCLIDGVVMARCETLAGSYDCVAMACANDYYLNGGQCKKQTVINCGRDGSKNCLVEAGVESAECQNSQCVINSCQKGFYMADGHCNENKATSCPVGDRVLDCRQAYRHLGWADGVCGDDRCQVVKCLPGYHLYDNNCEPDDNENCGTHGHSCYGMYGATVTSCMPVNGIPSCQVIDCDYNHYLDNNSRTCRALDVHHCGFHGDIDCTANEGWGDGACRNHQCVLHHCRSGYALDTHIGANTCDCDPANFIDPDLNRVADCVYKED